MKSLQLSTPHCLIMVGIPGSGKTTFAERFADTFSAPFLNADTLNAGERTHDVAVELLDQFFKTKQTIVFEGVGGARTERNSVAKLAKKHGYEPLYIWVQTDPQAAKQRVTRSTQRTPAIMSEEEFDAAVKRFTTPSATEKAVVLSGMHTYASQAKAVLRRLSSENPRPEGIPTRNISGRRLSIQ